MPGLLGGDHAALDGLLADAFAIQTGAVVADFDVHLAAFVKSPQDQPAGRIFAGLDTVLGKFDAVVDRIAHQMRERILDRLDDSLIELGLLAFHLDVHLFAAAKGDVAHRARELAQILPIGCIRVFMTSSCSSVAIRFMRWETACRPASRGVGDLQKLIARQHQLADERHQLVEKAHRDANGVGRG